MLLAVVSGTQLGLGLAGLAQALRTRRSYDIGFMRGRPAIIGREQWLTGTSLSAPGVMLVLQAVSTVGLRSRHHALARRTLLVLGVVMSLGYPAERDVRQAWRHGEMPTAALAGGAEVLAVAMAVLASRPTTDR